MLDFNSLKMPGSYVSTPIYAEQLEWCLSRCHPAPLRILDVGLGWGVSALFWLTRTDAMVTTVDINPNGHDVNPELYEVAERTKRWSLVVGDSAPTIAEMAPATFDLAYIDAGHKYPSPLDDMLAAWDRLRDGGLLCGHDLEMAGVKWSLDEFSEMIGREVETNFFEERAYPWRPMGVFAVEKPGADRPKPFLTILTRTFNRRPTLMREHNASIAAQTNRDFEHRLIVDHRQAGIGASHLALGRLSFDGEYAACVDDDDVLAAPDVVERVVAILRRERPPVAFVKIDHPELGILPKPWQGQVQMGTISSQNFIVRRDVWERCKHAWGNRYEGDWDFIEEVLRHYQPLWIDLLWVRCLAISRGAAEKEAHRKMEVKILIACTGLWGSGSEGEIINVDPDIAESLIRGGLAMDPNAKPEEMRKKAPKKSTPEKES